MNHLPYPNQTGPTVSCGQDSVKLASYISVVCRRDTLTNLVGNDSRLAIRHIIRLFLIYYIGMCVVHFTFNPSNMWVFICVIEFLEYFLHDFHFFQWAELRVVGCSSDVRDCKLCAMYRSYRSNLTSLEIGNTCVIMDKVEASSPNKLTKFINLEIDKGFSLVLMYFPLLP